MNLDGANILNENNDYKIYTMNSATSGQYCVVLPNNGENNMNMLVDLHMKEFFDGLTSGTKTKEEVIETINKEYGNVKGKYANCILVLPMLDEQILNNSILNNDKQKMFDEVKKIGAITSEIYKKLTDSGIDKNKISQQIVIVEKGDNDNKFVTWLKEQMPNFVDGFNYEENNTNSNSNINPFANTNEQPQVTNDIFGSAPAKAIEPAPATEEIKPEEPVAQTIENNEMPQLNNIFGNETQVTPEPVVEPAPVVEEPKKEQAPVEEKVQTEPVQVEQTTVEPMPTQETAVADNNSELKPVESQELNGTTTFSPIVNQDNNTGNETVNATPAETRPKSGGFANLLILLVILVGVTFISIELGKYLYSVYGA